MSRAKNKPKPEKPRAPPKIAEWRAYEAKAAKFFKGLGLRARSNVGVEGARASHKLDVWVQGSHLGIPFNWVIECKAWKSKVKKEQVLNLAAVTQDIGADRGFLLSEVGFQPSASRAATSTNITLTSLAGLRALTYQQFKGRALATLTSRLTRVRERLRYINRQNCTEEPPPAIVPFSRLALLDLAIADATLDRYPNIYLVDHRKQHVADSLEELIVAADRLITAAERWQLPKELIGAFKMPPNSTEDDSEE